MNRRAALQMLSFAEATAMMIPAALATGPEAAGRTADTVYELRVYHLNEGKLPLILDRFRTKEVAIFKRLGMTPVAIFTPTDDPANAEPGGRTLVYILRHPSREAAAAAWSRFRADPEWIALKAETEKDGPFLVKADVTFLRLTDFSPAL